MIGNDADAIGQFMADDWIVVGVDGRICDKTRFLDLVRSGTLSHDVMESENFRARIYGDAAVVVSDNTSGGKYLGNSFHERERSSCFFVRESGQWRCVLTHLSRLPSEKN